MHSFDRQHYTIDSFDKIFDRTTSGAAESEEADTAAPESAAAEQPSGASSSGLVEDVDFDTAIAEVLMSLATGQSEEAAAAADEPAILAAELSADAPILREGVAGLGMDDEVAPAAPIPLVVIDAAGPAKAGSVPEVFVGEAVSSMSIAPIPPAEAAGIDQPDEASGHLDDDDDAPDVDTARAAEAATFRLLGELERLWQAAA